MRSGGTFWFTFEGGTASKRAAREAEAKLKGGLGMPAHSVTHVHSSSELGGRHRIGAETSDVLLVAGGIGINPLFAIMCQYGQCLKEALEEGGGGSGGDAGGGGGGGSGSDGGGAVLHWNTGENAPSSPPRLHLLYSVTSKAGELRPAVNRFAGTTATTTYHHYRLSSYHIDANANDKTRHHRRLRQNWPSKPRFERWPPPSQRSSTSCSW